MSHGNVLISVIMQVTALIAQHNCSSSARRLTTTPTAAWVASRGIKRLRKDPNMGPKELKSSYKTTTNVKFTMTPFVRGDILQ